MSWTQTWKDRDILGWRLLHSPESGQTGGTGDVSLVWWAFDEEFDWVMGVAGNHDLFENSADSPNLLSAVNFLDDRMIVVESHSIAGLSGIPGNPRRPWRPTEHDFVMILQKLLVDRPDVLLMHPGPDLPEYRNRGLSSVRRVLENAERTLVVCGHAHWDYPLAEISNGTQVLNVDARVVILTKPND